MYVVVVSNKERLVEEISIGLRVAWPQVNIVVIDDCGKAIDLVDDECPDIVLLDLELREADSLTILGQIRCFSDVPVMIITSSQAETDRVRGLELGADECITRPFSMIEFIARVRALLRRTQAVGFSPPRLVSVGELSINLGTHEVFLSGNRIRLTPIEYRLLSELALHHGKVVSRRVLLEKAWGSEYIDAPEFVKKYIHRLRVKLEPDTANPRMLLTERGIGYKLVESI